MKRFFIGLAILIIALAAGFGIAFATFDINQYRDQIAETLGKETGRTVKLGGPIKFGLTEHGLVLGIRDAAIGNPAWASRAAMAGIGRFELGLALWPLLHRQISITSLAIDNADILLESASGDRHNWVLQATPPGTAQPAGSASASAISIHVDNLEITDSQLAVRGEDGSATVFRTDSLTFGKQPGGTVLNFRGTYNGMPIGFDMQTDAEDLMAKDAHNIEISLATLGYRVKAQGQIGLGTKKAVFNSWEMTAGKSELHGKLIADWSGARTVLKGTLVSDHLAPADFAMPGSANAPSAAPSVVRPHGPKRVFSDAPLGLEGLRATDALIDITIGEVPLGGTSLHQIYTKVTLLNGHLFLSPFKAMLGGGEVSGQFNLDAGPSPARLGVSLNASGVNLSDMLEIGGAEAFLSGKVDADMNIASSGDSAHALASNLSGTFNMVGAGGDVISRAADKISTGLAEIFSAGTGKGTESMNCLVARFIASNGIVRDQGILVDTSATTVAGSGGFDLRNETIDLMLRAKTKGVDVGGFLPPLHITGSFRDPDFSLNAQAVIQNVAGLLTEGTLNDGIPDVATEQGQNACLYTLNHPSAAGAATPQGGVVQDLAGKAGQATQKLNDLGGKLLKGWLGQ